MDAMIYHIIYQEKQLKPISRDDRPDEQLENTDCENTLCT